MDLRDYLKKLQAVGQLKVIDQEVDWNLQAGAICSLSNKLGGRAVHFRKVKDYSGSSLAGSLYTGPSNLMYQEAKPWSRQAVAMGLDLATSYEDFVASVLEAIANPLMPTLVTSGPCKENVLIGSDADIMKFPIPYLHEGDGGRYGTISSVIVKDPETGGQNWGCYRWMVLGPDRLTGPFLPGKGITMVYQKYEAKKAPMPFCITLGGDPANLLASVLFAPPGVDEVALAGGIRREPITLVKAETCDILVPADAEVVIEGEVLPGERAEEGPFQGWLLRFPKTLQPVYRIKCITHRERPIIPSVAEGGKYSDSLSLLSTAISVELTRLLGAAGFRVRWVNLPVETMLALCVVCMPVTRSAEPNVLVSYLLGLPAFTKFYDKVIVIEDDIDAVEWVEILKAWGYKCHPWRNINFVQGTPSFLSRYSNSDEKSKPVATKVIFDATIPYWWDKGWMPTKLGFEASYPVEIQERVIEKWKERGLPGVPYLRKKTR